MIRGSFRKARNHAWIGFGSKLHESRPMRLYFAGLEVDGFARLVSKYLVPDQFETV